MTKYAHLKEVEEGGCRTSTSKSTSEIVISSSSASTLTARLYNIFFALSLLIFGFAAGFSLNMSDEIFGSADRPGILGTDTTATIIKQIMESRYDPPPLFVPGKLYGKVFNKGGKLKDQKLTNIPNLVHITLQNKNSPDWIVGSWKANNRTVKSKPCDEVSVSLCLHISSLITMYILF